MIQYYSKRTEKDLKIHTRMGKFLDKALQIFHHDLLLEIFEGIKEGRVLGHSHVYRAVMDYIETIWPESKTRLWNPPFEHLPLKRSCPLRRRRPDSRLNRRTWKLKRQNKIQINTFFKKCLRERSSTANIAQDLKQSLKDPNHRRLKRGKN